MTDVRKHSPLPPSSAARWIACPPSALKNAEIEDQPTEAALEETDAHSLCEYKVKTALGEKAENPIENIDFYNAEMEQYTDGYLQFVLEQIEKAKASCNDPIVLIEQKLDFTNYVPHGFGTGDCVIVADDNLTVIDFKYGLGVIVESENNPQMMCYAISNEGLSIVENAAILGLPIPNELRNVLKQIRGKGNKAAPKKARKGTKNDNSKEDN